MRGRQSERDYYEVLGIAPSASAEEIRRAYHKRAFQCHPDRNQGGDEANKEMQEINEIYTILSDPITRREYDLPRGYGSKAPKFKKGSKVKISANYPSPYSGHTGVVDKEPVRDTFRFWYMVRIESNGLTTVTRFAEEELEKPDDWHLDRPVSVRNR
jgi:curved DNA-binding protein CbpA